MNDQNARSNRLHYELIRGIVDGCVVPPRDQIRERLECSEDELTAAFKHLASEHGVVLHPESTDVWAVHPFSLAPTSFLVESGKKKWWGNCAWCSLGVAVLVNEPCVITTTLGAESEQVQLIVQEGQVKPNDFLVHFPIPMAHAWDNVVYTCSTMLLFKNERQISDWCGRHRIALGDIQPVTKVLELAKRWYGEHLRPDWRKKSIAEAQAIFKELGLDHPTWSLPISPEERF